jgi:competence protein ComEA
MYLPYFSRAQTGVILFLAAALFFLYAWRANFWQHPSPAAPPPQNLTFIEVTGAVSRPGVYAFSTPPSLPAVLDKAGGPALPAPANQPLASGSRIDVDQSGHCRVGRMAGQRLLTLGLPVHLNEATAEDLEALPGVGPVLAGRIIAHRSQHGPFRRVDDLEEVSGFGPQSLEQLRPHLTLETPPN